MTKKINPNKHHNYVLLTVIAILIPFIGLIIGLVYLTKDKPVDQALGNHLVLVSFLVWLIFFTLGIVTILGQ